jgi:hypothetical protein
MLPILRRSLPETAAIATLMLCLGAAPAPAAGYGYCQLWSRAVTEIEVRAGKQMNLILFKENLAFAQADDVDIAVADANLVEIRNAGHYRTCRFLEEYDELPLPDVGSAQTSVWAQMLAAHARGRQPPGPEPGTVPASDAPPAPEGWAEACGAEWRSFDPSDGTVVRPKSKGGKQRCPLVKGDDGLWVIP